MEDHQSEADSLVEVKQELIVTPSNGNPLYRKAHFLKPIFTQDHPHLPPSPTALFASKPTYKNLENCTLQSYKGFSHPMDLEKWKLWVQKLKPKYEDIWKKAGIYGAILASIYTVPKDKKLIICLAERWCVDTNTFVFSWGEVTVTLEDIIHMGCFSVLGASVLSPLDHDCSEIFKSLKYHLKKIKLGHCNNALSHVWMDYFISSGDQLEHEAFLVLWLSKFVLVRSQIAVWDFRVAIHLSRGKRIALAPVVLACIYRDMRLLHNLILRSFIVKSRFGLKYNICHYDLVQMWVWERFIQLRPFVNIIGSGEPRSARWNRVVILKVNDVRTVLDSASLSFVWRPYALGSSNNMLSNMYKDTEQWVIVESDAVESYARCLRASELVGSGSKEQYLPHRVARQFGLDQDVPSHVFQSTESAPITWNSYGEPIRGVELYIPPRHFESGVSSRYVLWWRGLVAVNEEIVTNSVQIEKQLPPVSGIQKRDGNSLPASATLSGNLEETPEVYVAEDGLTNSDQHTRKSRKTGNTGKIADPDHEPVLNSSDDAEEDSLTIAQLLNQSGRENSFEKVNDTAGDELLLNNFTLEFPQNLNYTSKAVEFPVQITSSTDKFEKSKSSAEKQTEVREDTVVSRNLRFASEPAEMCVHSIPNSDKLKNGQISKEREIARQEDAVRNPEDSITNIEEENCEESNSELQHRRLEARIWRLETIFKMMKAAKFAGTCRGNEEK
ncbi:hypothetical protein DCAR_0831053 [Daucus carota subsp. sativus]|uniref:Aminotransferase-like plant mobile domain-containing protein n=1 Tax=Daucus carota subsp. sativus TaxID=79200 RepID=A0AAF0XR29_DAUCS|nr:PREDICTED: uncharacterized protein LOC108198130 [Daucus carota subsp. sativus]WOH11564.1 hypothetical protein DCAR_0831053 [Daucus carota subsp. sativus]